MDTDTEKKKNTFKLHKKLNTLQNIGELLNMNSFKATTSGLPPMKRQRSTPKQIMHDTSRRILKLQNRDSANEAKTHLQQLPFPILTFGMFNKTPLSML